MAKRQIRIATRASKLALWQAHWVRDALLAQNPELDIVLLEMTTEGDRFLAAPLAKVGGKGLFVKELEAAMLDGRADLAVHSMKDVPVTFPEGLGLAVICPREDPSDAFVAREGVEAASLDALPPGARVGTASLRRASQVKALRPDLETAPVRGNVQTRLAKLDRGEFDAIVLASAGLLRLELGDRIRSRLAAPAFLPAGGQGAVGIETRLDDEALKALLAPLACPVTTACVSAERRVSARLGGNCSVPLAAYCVQEAQGYRLQALVADPSGAPVLRAEARGPEPLALGDEVAEALLAAGAGPLLEAVVAAQP
ncbi:MAG: hydroxymethylbilane synthase [Pseudomonadota bacterium]|jgi:hydroxymethylbilane synthase|nr:hydroxymethylbilane synthase [Pseudomonadales bacterium]MBL6807754.1 hydroxymethylbilane synthase [Pseudomonadales bacterium]